MANTLGSILDIVARKVGERAGGRQSSRGGGILDQLVGFLGQRSQTGKRNVRPASEDPYGDPADGKGARGVRPASEDPYGDPADRK